jgi:hypothetical protein
MQSKHLIGALARNHQSLFKLDALKASRSYLGVVCSCVIDKQATHDICGHSDKVLAALPIDAAASKTQICLIDESSRL